MTKAKWSQLLLGVFAIAFLIGSAWVVVGSVWFPEWWYPVVWNGKVLDSDYLLTGLFGSPFDELAFRISICLGLLLLVLSYLFWQEFRKWVYHRAAFIIKFCVGGLIVDAFVLYETQVGPPPLLQTLLVGSVSGILLLWRLPPWQVARSQGLTYQNRFDRENEARKTVAQILGGFFLLVGLYSSVQTFNLSREGQITDRFTKAIEQLGAVDGKSNPKLEVRLGGVYALERISLDSERDYKAIMEILTTYVREYSPAIKDGQKEPNQHQAPNLQRPSVDIQAILTVLGRREIKFPPAAINLDLRRTNLGGADLSGTHGLIVSNLSGSNLSGADLSEADLGASNLNGANLRGAHLRRANLRGANFSGANFVAADCQGADLRFTNLSKTDLGGADLAGANLGYADLRGAVLTQMQVNAALGNRSTQLPTGIKMPDTWMK